MTFSGDDAQAAKCLDLLVLLSPLSAQAGDFFFLRCGVERFVGLNHLNAFFNIAAQHNVSAAACHVGGNRHHFCTPGLGHDVSLSRMLLGVQHLVGQVFFVQQLVNDFRVFNRRGTHQHRLAALVAFANVLDGRFVLFPRGFVNTVQLVFTLALAVGRDDGGL